MSKPIISKCFFFPKVPVRAAQIYTCIVCTLVRQYQNRATVLHTRAAIVNHENVMQNLLCDKKFVCVRFTAETSTAARWQFAFMPDLSLFCSWLFSG